MHARNIAALSAALAIAVAASRSDAAITPTALHPVAPAGQIGTRLRLPVFAPEFGGRFGLAGVGVGKVIHTGNHGQVFGFAIDRSGDDGLLASIKFGSGGNVISSVELFSQSGATVGKVVERTRTMDDFVAEGIGAGDVGLVLHEHVISNQIVRTFQLLDPVSGGAITGLWTPPHHDNFLFGQLADDQTTATAAVLGNTLGGQPLLFSSDLATNTFGPEFRLDTNTFGRADGPQLAEDTATGEAVIATSPDGGAVGGKVPLIAVINLSTGAKRTFPGLLIPPFNSGFVNGLAVDSATGIAATTTELDAAVEFYDLATGIGTFTFLPGSKGNQFNSGTAVANDATHGLFFVAQPNGSVGPAGGSVVDVFDEQAHLVESITGFSTGLNPQLAVNPATRTGFVSGPTIDAITEFSY